MANKRLNATITIAGAVAGSLRGALQSTKSQIGQVGAAIRDAEKRQRLLSRSITEFGRLGKNVSGMRERYAAVTAEIERQRRALGRLQRVEDLREKNAKIGSSMRGMVGAGIAAVATLGAPVVQAARFENAMLGVAKQLDGARDANGKLTAKYYEMAEAVQKLGRELPIPTNEIAKMVAAGLRMGVASGEVLEFVRNSAKMATAFELPEEELAEQMGKIATLYRIPIPAIGSLADSINYLDDNAISKGGDIIDFLQRVGGVAASVKITGNDMAAIGSTLLTLGERAEIASTATNAFFQKLAAADKGTKKFRSALADLGLSTAEIQSGMQSDAMGTMLKVLDAVGKLPKEKRLGALVELVGLEHSDTIAKLAANTEELRKQIKLANSEAAKGSVDREFAARMETTVAQWETFKNIIGEIGVNVGSVLLPSVNSALKAIGGIAASFATFARENPRVIQSIMTVGGALAAFGVGKLAVMGVVWAFNALRLAIMANPIGLAVTALVTAGVLIYQNWDKLKELFGAVWAAVKHGAELAWGTLKNTFLNYTLIGQIIKRWEPITKMFGAITGVAGRLLGGDRTTIGQAGSASSPAVPAGAPPLPTPAGATTNSSATTNQTNTFNITAQPGQSPQQIADEVMKKIDLRHGVRQRGLMYDGAGS